MSNSRAHKKRASVWRRRKCSNCNTVFTTIEQPALADARLVMSSSGTTAPFNLGKLIISIATAFSHDPARGNLEALWLAQTVESTLITQVQSLTTEDIEAVTHQVLKQFDEVAAIQYAARHQLITSASAKRRGRPSLVLRDHGMPK